MIEYWLRNSPDASWTTLANAVERMGGHANLAKTLREKGKSEEESDYMNLSQEEFMEVTPSPINLDTCTECNILLLGKMRHGKSTLGNKFVNSDGYFRINDRNYPQTSKGSVMITSATQHKRY